MVAKDGLRMAHVLDLYNGTADCRVALYPDPLLGEVPAAFTYPFEIAEAEQRVHDNLKWKPPKLMNEGKKQSWDSSI